MRSPALGALVFLAAAGSVSGQTEDGALAPAACWTTAGGSASRSGAAAGDPLRGPIEVAWRFPKNEALKGDLEGEPLVWDNRIVVVIREGTKRTIQILDLLDGRAVCRGPTITTEGPLEPCLWNGVLVLRTTPTKLEAWRLRPKETEKMGWFYQSKLPLSAPAMIGREVYVRSGDSIVRLAVGRTDPVWEKRSRFRGAPSVRGKHVYALDYDGLGVARLVWLRRSDGARAGEAVTGGHGQERIPDDSADARIAVLDDVVALQHALPVVSSEGPMSMTAFKRTVRGSEGGIDVEFLGLLPLCEKCGVSPFGKGWIAQMQEPKGRQLVAFESSLAKAFVLADKTVFAEFLGSAPPSSCGGVAFLGGNAVDASTRRILWSHPVTATARPVPARDAVLVTDAGQRLVALRRTAGQRAPRLMPQAAESRPGGPIALGEARALLRDGSCVEGRLALDREHATLAKEGAKGGAPFRLDDVLLVEDAGRKLLYAGPGDAATRGIIQLVERGLGEAYVALALEADKTQDTALMERLVGEAWERGAAGKDLDRAEAKLKDRLAQKSAAPKPDEVRKILEKEKAARAEPAGAIWQRFEALPPDAFPELRADLLAAVVARVPDHAGAAEVVRKQIPAGVPVSEPFETAEWLDFVTAIRQTPIEIVVPPKPEDPDPTYVQRELGAARASWRPDLVGIQSKSLLIISPIRQPGRIARCLSGGELVCDTLEKLFAGGTVKRDKRHPIKLFLYETEEEYLKQSERAGQEASHLAWTAGHYAPIEGVARMYLPPGKAGFAKVFDVYAHEMTHAWIEERCPLFSSAGRGHMQRMAPGNWIVEGFATLIENLEFDLEERSWRVKREPPPLEQVANAREEDLHKWSTLYKSRYTYFGALDPAPKFQASSRWMLGIGYQLSKVNLFYAQAGATCLYLFEAENGKYRDRLMKYVGDHYGARAEQLDIQTAFGLSPDELGAKVLEYAKSVAGHGGK